MGKEFEKKKNLQNLSFWLLTKVQFIDVSFFYLNMEQHNVLCDLANVWQKSGSSIMAKILTTNQIAGFLNTNIFGRDQLIS